jgi:hypothetical protein
MSIIGSNILAGASGQAGGGGAYEISKSVRFSSSDSAYLSRTPASSSNRKTFTWAGWVKLCAVPGTYTVLFGAGAGGSDSGLIRLNYESSGKLNLAAWNTDPIIRTASVYRDFSAWYHIVVAVDTANATASNRAKIYINGTEAAYDSDFRSSISNLDTPWNNNVFHAIGRLTSSDGQYANAYFADVYNIDGQALDPSSFGEFDTNGVWQPIAYTGTYGTNGFRLPFSDNSTAAALGTDTSSNGNTWTVNNISVTAGAGNDSLVDTPTNGSQVDTGVGGEVVGNYCTWNPLNTASNLGLANGNLDTTSFSGSSDAYSYGTIGVSSGKWYYEATPTTVIAASFYMIGWGRGNKLTSNGSDEYLYYSTGARRGASSASYGASWTAGDVIGIALDLNAGTLVFYKNGVSQGTAFTGITGTVFPKFGYWHGLGNFNFGQRPFAYPLSGFKALCTTNLPEPTIADGSTVMDVKLYTGNGSTQTISGLGFSPDFLWIKRRNTALDHFVWDSVRGITKELYTNQTYAEGTATNKLTSLDSNGFTVQNNAAVNALNDTYVAWTWDAGSSTVTNTAGSITSQVRANASAGFSVVTYTGNASNATVGHGLGVAPSLYIVKARTSSGFTDFWSVYHRSLGATAYIKLNSTDAQNTGSTIWNSTAPTSTVFSVNSASIANESGVTYVAYCFAPVAGYSSFGSYLSNASSDGPFVYTGMRPRWLMIKLATSESTRNWIIIDAARNTYNAVNNKLAANSSASENDAGVTGDGTANLVDFLSNGFKLRTGNGDTNGLAGYTYIWAAFAESPFQYARAR